MIILMNGIKKKKVYKEDKLIMESIRDAAGIDETKIEIFGDESNTYMQKILYSFKMALACNHKLDDWIIDLEGLSGRKFRYLLNNLISCFNFPSYLEIGSWLGSTACSALFKNKLRITCVDNWSQNFDSQFGKNCDSKRIFEVNINRSINKYSKFNLISSNFKKVDFQKIQSIDIYFYDGPHHREDHFESIIRVHKSLHKKFILIVDDWNWIQVREGTLRGIDQLNMKVISKLEIKTTQDNSKPLIQGKYSDWHNGYCFFVINK